MWVNQQKSDLNNVQKHVLAEVQREFELEKIFGLSVYIYLFVCLLWRFLYEAEFLFSAFSEGNKRNGF